MSLSMQVIKLKGKRRRKRNKFRPSLNLSQEKASYFFFYWVVNYRHLWLCCIRSTKTKSFTEYYLFQLEF